LTQAISQHQVERHFSLLQEQGINQSEWHLIRRDGEDITIEIASIQVDDNHFIHVFDDVTEQRRASAEIERAWHAAETANRIKSEFLSNISHEIRTPLNGIIGLSHLALMGNLGMQQRDYVEKIGQSGRTLLRIINELLDFAKIEAQRMEFERISFSLDELLDELSSVSAQIPAEKALEVVFQAQPNLPRTLVGDRLRIGQCLSNLLSNAIKFTPSGSVILEITAAGEENGRTLLNFCVADSGIGIAPEVLEPLRWHWSWTDHHARPCTRHGW
jgi:signal transduction histidine kinase